MREDESGDGERVGEKIIGRKRKEMQRISSPHLFLSPIASPYKKTEGKEKE
jgi:hypothetical protein